MEETNATLAYERVHVARDESLVPWQLLVLVPVLMVLLNIGCALWAQAAIASFLPDAGIVGLVTDKHPSHEEWWSLWVPGLASWGALIGTFLLLLMSRSFRTWRRDVPWGWFVLMVLPSCFLTVWLVLNALYYFVLWG